MVLDEEGEALVEAAAIARLIHEDGSSGLVRALNARLARALLACARRIGTGCAQIEHEVDRWVAVMRGQQEG